MPLSVLLRKTDKGLFIVLTFACPSHWLIVAKSTSALSSWTAVVWRREWGCSRLSLSVGATAALAAKCFFSR